MKIRKYCLDAGGEPVPVDNMSDWAKWYENTELRRIAETTLGKLWISTVFLGIDHNFSGSGDPVLWEVMIFCGSDESHPLHEYQERCSGSRKQALQMHARTVQYAQEWLDHDTLPRRWLRILKRHVKTIRKLF